jgi:hypothetical protein
VVDLAISVASGTPWLGRFPCPNPGAVALFPGEEDAYELRRRFQAVAEPRGARADELPIHLAENTPTADAPRGPGCLPTRTRGDESSADDRGPALQGSCRG